MSIRIFLTKLAVSLFLTPSCISQQNHDNTKAILDSYLGTHKSVVIQKAGPPTKYASDGSDGEILVYEKKRTKGAYINGYIQESTIIEFVEMDSNSQGVIYHWRAGRR